MAARSNVPTRRPTINRPPPGQQASASSPTTRRQISTGEDDVLIIEKTQNSIGKTGAVERGVTRPKRRLSSLPTLPHPFFGSSPNRAASNSRPSPPTTPTGTNPTYHALHNHLSSVTNPYQARPLARTEERNMSSVAAASKDETPRLWGIELKWISLITLALQNACLTIIMHYSRISASPDRTYSAAAAVFLNELLKGVVSIFFALKVIDKDLLSSSSWDEKDPKNLNRDAPSRIPSYLFASRFQNLVGQVFSPDCYKLSVPAILYVIQNNLQYVAASNLDVATFQVTYQMKILTTAFFSVIMLRRRLSRTKWIALVLLAVGVGIVQIQSASAPAQVSPPPVSAHEPPVSRDIPDEPVIELRVMHPFRGFVAVILACITSGLAGVYFEFILKSSGGSTTQPNLWVRNTQLSLFSLVPALVPILFGGSDTPGVGWFQGVIGKFSNFNGWAVATVLNQTFGGLITAIVIRYSDNIMKGFATSLSIIISSLASVALFSYPITLTFIIGSSIVLAATFIYNSPAAAPPTTRASVAVPPGSPVLTSAPILGEPEKPSRVSSVVNLLGLGTGSAAPSRAPSQNDLKSYANRGLAAQSMVNGQIPSSQAQHIYAASAPGSPYMASSNTGSPNSNLQEAECISPIPLAPVIGGLKRYTPNLTVDTGRR